MAKSFSTRPKPSNNYAKIVFFVTLGVAAVLFVAYFLMDSYKGIVGTVALFVLVTAILIYTKFISPAFYYDVICDDGEVPLFVVRQITGRRSTTLCRVELADIISITHETDAEMREHKTPNGYRKYVYTPTLFPNEVYRLTVVSKYENAEIIIEISEELSELLRSLVVEAKELRANSEDE